MDPGEIPRRISTPALGGQNGVGGHALSRTTSTVGQFVNYLWFPFNEKSLVWSIRLHRAAIAMIVDPLTKTSLSQHPMIRCFRKAIYLAHPPPRTVKPIWSVSSVLVMLRTWGNPEDLTRAKLTWQLAMLLALAPARRASDLSFLDIDEKNLLKSDDSWRFSLVFRAKQATYLKTLSFLSKSLWNYVPSRILERGREKATRGYYALRCLLWDI